MAKITDDIKFNLKMSELASKEYNSVLKNIQPALLQYNEILSNISAPVKEMAYTYLSDNLQVFIDKLKENLQIYQPVIDSTFLNFDELIPKFDSVLLNLSKSLEQINLEKCSNEEQENIQIASVQLDKVNKTIHTPSKKFTREDVYTLIQIILAIFTIFQAHYYYTLEKQDNAITQIENEKFQNAVIELLQEIADNSNEPVEVHHHITGNIQIQVDETP